MRELPAEIKRNNIPDTVSGADVARGMVNCPECTENDNPLKAILTQCIRNVQSKPYFEERKISGVHKGLGINRRSASFMLKTHLADWMEKHDIGCIFGNCANTKYINSKPKFYDYSNDEKKILRDEL